MRRAAGAVVLLAFWAGISAVGQSQRKPYEPPVRRAVRGVRGAVAAGTDHGTEAGLRMYHLGGNAVDAGAAATFVGSIAEFAHFGFGGEAPILIRTREGKVFSIAGLGTMPKAATADFFRNRRMKPGEFFGGTLEPNGLKGIVPVAGILPALVPGMVDAVLVAVRDFGTRSVAEVMQPAIELADGIPLDESCASGIVRSHRFFELWPTSKRLYLAQGRFQMPGEIFRQPDLARTMREMVQAEQKALKAGASRTAAIDAVRDYFYRGEIARKIDQFMKENQGLLRYEDMAAFKLQPEPALTTTYRGYEVYKPSYWSQGPVLLETLNILEGLDLKSMRPNSTEYLHQVVEALKLTYADRDTYYGDPKFVEVPAELMTKAYGAERRALIGGKGSLDFRPGRVGNVRRQHPSEVEMARYPIDDALMASDTTCINAMDANGVIFSTTPSGAWLPSVIAGDTGIPLTQRAQSFLLVEGHPNELAGGKRPRVTLSPTLVTRAGKPYMALSTPGGDNQDQSLLQLLLNVIEFGMDAQEAVESPRFQTRHLVASFDNHAMGRGELILDERISKAALEELAARGHRVSSTSKWNSGSHPVIVRMMSNGVIEAGADPYGYRTAAAW